MPPELVAQLQVWSAANPALAGVVQAQASPPLVVQPPSDMELDRLVSSKQTEMAKSCEMAAKNERMASQE
eukprot:5164189-Pyramimonas_sp.AAC.1